MTGVIVTTSNSGTKTSQLAVTLELQTQPQSKLFTILLFLALLCLRRQHLLISRHLVTTHQMVANSTLAVALQRGGTSTLTAGEQAVQYSSML